MVVPPVEPERTELRSNSYVRPYGIVFAVAPVVNGVVRISILPHHRKTFYPKVKKWLILKPPMKND